jgi:hypothetical protein
VGAAVVADGGRPRRSTGSRSTARMSVRSRPRACAAWATTWLLPTPGGPHRNTGRRWG